MFTPHVFKIPYHLFARILLLQQIIAPPPELLLGLLLQIRLYEQRKGKVTLVSPRKLLSSVIYLEPSSSLSIVPAVICTISNEDTTHQHTRGELIQMNPTWLHK